MKRRNEEAEAFHSYDHQDVFREFLILVVIATALLGGALGFAGGIVYAAVKHL